MTPDMTTTQQRGANAEPKLARLRAQLRVRSHGDMARIEVPPADIPRLATRAEEIAAALKSFGFTYVALDLQGYRTGSLNEELFQKASMRVVS